MIKVQSPTELDGLGHVGIINMLPVVRGSLADKELCHVSNCLFAKRTVFESYWQNVSGSGFMMP